MRDSIKHILVTGSHRSGTTWVGKTISRHPGIRYVHEPFNVNYPNGILGLKLRTWFTYCQASSQKEEIKTSFDRLLQSTPLHYAIQVCRASGLDVMTPLRFGKHFILSSIKPRFLIKDPLALLSAGWLHETYDFKVICMIRNPIAFVGSLKKADWDFNFENLQVQDELMRGWLSPFIDEVDKLSANSGDFIDRASLLWNVLHFVISDYEKRYPSWLFVKHEDMALNPVPEFQRIFEYLGLTMNSNVLAYIEKFTSSRNPIETTSTGYQPRNSKKSLDSWKERLTAIECERVKIATRNIAVQFYEEDYLPVVRKY